MTELLLKTEQDTLNALTNSSRQIAEECAKVEITDETTLAIAQNIFAKANDKAKEIEKLRVQLKEPYFQAGKQIDIIAKAISKPIEDAVVIGKGKIIAFDKLKKEIAQKEANRIQGIRNEIQKYSADAISELKSCKNEEDLINTNNKWLNKYLIPDSWKELSAELRPIQVDIFNLATQLQIELTQRAEADPETTTVIEEVIAEQVSNIGNRAIVESSAEKTRGMTGTWKHRVVDAMLVPRDLLMVDDFKVKEFLKMYKETVVSSAIDGIQKEMLPGIEFYFEPSVRF